MSDWEVVEPEWQEFKPSIFKKTTDFVRGTNTGVLQGLADMGANIAQAPFDAATYFFGAPHYDVPRGDVSMLAPKSEESSSGQNIGNFIAPFVAGGGVSSAVRGLPLLTRMLTGAGFGAGTANTGDRTLGGLLGGLFASDVPFTKGSAARELKQAKQLGIQKGNPNLPVPEEPIKDLQSLLDVQGLSARKPSLERLIEKAKTGNYQSMFDLQSDMQKIASQLKRSPFAHERGLSQELGGIRQNYLQNMRQGLESKGHKDIADLMKKGQTRYREYNKVGIPLKTALAATIGAEYIPSWIQKLYHSSSK